MKRIENRLDTRHLSVWMWRWSPLLLSRDHLAVFFFSSENRIVPWFATDILAVNFFISKYQSCAHVAMYRRIWISMTAIFWQDHVTSEEGGHVTSNDVNYCHFGNSIIYISWNKCYTKDQFSCQTVHSFSFIIFVGNSFLTKQPDNSVEHVTGNLRSAPLGLATIKIRTRAAELKWNVRLLNMAVTCRPQQKDGTFFAHFLL